MKRESGGFKRLARRSSSNNIIINYMNINRHVIVPYCSSDTWAGTGRSEVTGYYFHGKHIFRSDHHDLFIIMIS